MSNKQFFYLYQAMTNQTKESITNEFIQEAITKFLKKQVGDLLY
ncbi:MAG: hypothetical protein ACLUE7_01395 [Lachnospirales bacterium]